MMSGRSSPAAAVSAQIGLMAFLVLSGLPSRAAAQSVIIPDPAASDDTAELATAVSMLVRSSLKVAQHPIVPRRQLALAIEAASGHAPGETLSVPATLASKLLEQLGAESIVLWEIQPGPKGTQVGGTLVGPGGRRLLRVTATAATGDVVELSRQLARRIAPGIGATVTPTADLGLAELRPLLQAQSALLAQDSVAVARALDLAVPKLGAEASGQRPALQDIAADPGLSALPRAQALLLLGDYGAALERAEAGLASDGKNALLRTAKVRALAGRADFSAAEQEIQAIKAARSPSLVALAQVALGLARGDSPEKMTEALSPLIGRPAGEWRSVLPLIATAAPGTFGERGEAAALAAVEKLAQQEPGLASTLAARALLGGAKAQDAAPLIKVQDLSAEQVKSVGARLADQGGVAADLSRQIKAREEEAKAIAEAAGPEKPTGPPSALASNLRNVLQDFVGLYEPRLTTIAIAPLPGSGQPFYWPYLIRRERLGDGLIEALMRSPWELQASVSKVRTDTLPPERFTDEGMATLAHDIVDGAVLFYRVRPSGLAPWATLELVLFDPIHQRIEKIETSMVGRSTGLMAPSPLWIGLFVLACLAVLAWAVRVSLRGTIVVRVQWDSDAKDEMFSILISRRPQTPTIENITAYRKKMEWIGKRKRHFEAWNIDQNTTFRGIPRGKWHVHLYGIYTRGRQTLLLKEPPQIVEVQARKTAFVAHVLEAAEAEFKIAVVDDRGPVEGARVWLDDERAKGRSVRKERQRDPEGAQGVSRDSRVGARDGGRAPLPRGQSQDSRHDHQSGVGEAPRIRVAGARAASGRGRALHDEDGREEGDAHVDPARALSANCARARGGTRPRGTTSLDRPHRDSPGGHTRRRGNGGLPGRAAGLTVDAPACTAHRHATPVVTQASRRKTNPDPQAPGPDGVVSRRCRASSTAGRARDR